MKACRQLLCKICLMFSPSAHRLKWLGVGDREELSKSFCNSVGNQMQDLMPAKVNLMDKRVYFNLVTRSNSLHSHTNICACMSQGGKGCVIALPVLAAALPYFYLNCMLKYILTALKRFYLVSWVTHTSHRFLLLSRLETLHKQSRRPHTGGKIMACLTKYSVIQWLHTMVAFSVQ